MDGKTLRPIQSTSSSSSAPTIATLSAASAVSIRPRKNRKVSSSEDPSKRAASSAAVRVIPRPLSSDGEIVAALRYLRAADPYLARVIDAHELPTFQCLYPPFHALARSILYQQLAIKAGAAVYARFISLCGGESGVVPEVVLDLTPHQLRQIGVSGRKASYLHDLARKYHSGILSDATIVAMDDKSLSTMLTMVKGIGAWSVHMFMIFSLHRPDVLPVGDLGVRKGVQLLYGLEEVPRPSQMEQLCERWRPYRSVGSWYMWRLGEAKGVPPLASSNAEDGALDFTSVGGGAIPQPQLIDPIQILPSLG
ncbi:DNA-3-methyladenine glycosylase 1-like [Curcuma longa]|uniref:DNA-3-methyladenine glycosylase 1-like n=1 Tax=Curcuma longa TaxID=136217 RepID=UPI003D9E0999